MKNKTVTFRIKGKNEAGEQLSPETLDIVEVQNFLAIANKLITGDLEKESRGTVGLKYEEGSSLFKFILSASLATGFNADMKAIQEQQNLESVSRTRAVSIIELQEKAKKNNWEYEIYEGTPKGEAAVRISKETSYVLPADEWVEVEKVLYGELTDIGGSSAPNMHVKIEEGKTIKVPASKEETISVNDEVKVYHPIGVLVSAKENRKTKELDKDSIRFIQLVPFDGDMQKTLEESMKIGTDVWKDVADASDWIRKKRNNYE